jgi:hypothetical protein
MAPPLLGHSPLIWPISSTTDMNMKKGSSVVEAVIYIFIFSLLSLAVVNALQSVTRSYRLIQASFALESVGHTALERIARDARDSTSIDTAVSTFGTSPGNLVLNGTDSSGNDQTIEFYVLNGAIRVKENNVDIGPLTSSKATVTSLIFTSIITGNSQAVRIEVTAESGQGETYKSRTFRTTAVLRGSYAPAPL